MTITELSIKRPILVIVFFMAVALIGGYAYTNLKYETFPSMTSPVVSIRTTYEGASASEVESSLTKKVEEAVSGINKVNTIQSTSSEGSSNVTVQFSQDVDINVALQDVQNKLNQIAPSLPDEAGTPALSKFSSDDMPVMRMGVTSTMDPKAFYQYLNNTIKPQLSKQPGVGQISISGGVDREIRVNVDSQKLQAYGISNTKIASAIANANLDYPTGSVKDSDNQYVLRLSGKLSSVDQLKNLIIAQSNEGGAVRLSDVADVCDTSADVSTISRVNGKTSIGLRIMKQSDANEVEVCQSIRQTIQKLEMMNRPIHLKFNITQDGSEYTVAAANAVKEDLGIAILLVAIIMLIFLHSFRNSLIIMVAIPTSLIATFIGMWATGCTLNIITLLAMSLVIGILVDDSIVVLENIHHHLEKGEERKTAALRGRNEIGFTALSITMVDVVVFVPLSLVSGMIGGIMHQFALVVVMSTLMSLLVSFTVTPMLASRFSKAEQFSPDSLMGRFSVWFEAKYSGMVRSYLGLLRWSLGNRGKVLLLVGILFCAVMWLIPAGYIGSEFMPAADRGQINITANLANGTKLEKTDQVTSQIENILWSYPEVEKLFTSIGGTGGRNSNGGNSLEVDAMLVDKKKRVHSTDELCQIIKDRLDLIPGLVAHVNSEGIMGGGNGGAIRYTVVGNNWDQVYQGAMAVKKIVSQVPGTKDVQLSSEEGQPEVQVQIDRDKMAKLGLTIADVGSVLYTGFSGNTSSNFKGSDGNDYTIRVVYDQSDRSHTTDVSNVKFINSSGKLIQLSQFAKLVNSVGPTKLTRQDRNYSINVTSQAVGRTSGSIADDINKTLMRVKLPEGVSCMPGGQLKNQKDAFSSLGLSMLAAIIFVYFIMTALYNSFIYPFAVLFSIPLAMIGAILALGLTGNSLAIFSILGMIMQVGLVSKNAILLVDFTNRAREEGLGIKDALVEAGRERIRPILMTTLTMIFGMLPLAMSTTSGSEFKRGMGWALIGGLTSSMLMTLVVVPIIYTLVEQIREKLLLFAKKGKTSGAAGISGN